MKLRKCGLAFVLAAATAISLPGISTMAEEPDPSQTPVADITEEYIREQMEKDGTNFVWLSMAPIEKETILSHFPNIYEHCLEEGYDVTKECIPVVPAQHYFMGGIWVDKNSHTSMPQLFAVGETSCNGVHGANRLASNSLLESLVFAKRAANLIKEQWCLEKEQAV